MSGINVFDLFKTIYVQSEDASKHLKKKKRRKRKKVKSIMKPKLAGRSNDK